jgi:hypothetical protein
VLSQTNPFVGTWKLNLAKSKYDPGPPPKSETRTYAAQGDTFKVSFDGVGADRSHFAHGFTFKYDGKDYPITGSGTPGGADIIAVKRIDANTAETTLKKAGKVVLTTSAVVSKDGKATTITGKGTTANGQPINSVSVYDKQ